MIIRKTIRIVLKLHYTWKCFVLYCIELFCVNCHLTLLSLLCGAALQCAVYCIELLCFCALINSHIFIAFYNNISLDIAGNDN